MKALILAPHQDDEIILCGSFLKGMLRRGVDVHIVFLTNGNYSREVHTTRLIEALSVMKLYKIDEDNVIFLGYANEYDSAGPHLYNANEGEVLASQYGENKTYGLQEHPEYCLKKLGVHHKYTRENIINDLLGVLEEILPDVIFAPDVESHPDHIAASLLLDEALGIILKEKDGYHPKVYKKPEYHTSWFGQADYSFPNNCKSLFSYKERRTYVNEIASEFYNPYIRWLDRLRFPVDEFVRTKNERNNIVYRALELYQSQDAVKHFKMLVNSDVVFWGRRTDSLTYKAKVSASSGEVSYLHDFKIIDSRNIGRKSYEGWKTDQSVWRPGKQDCSPWVEIDLGKKYNLEKIVIYQTFCSSIHSMKCKIYADGDFKNKVWQGLLNNRKQTVINISGREAVKLRFEFDIPEKVEPAGISEIEVFESRKAIPQVFKLTIDDNFVYDYLVSGNGKEKLGAYAFTDDFENRYFKFDELILTITDEQGKEYAVSDVFDEKGHIKFDKWKGILVIQGSTKMFPEIRDKIVLFRRQNDLNRYMVGKRQIDFTDKKIYFIGTPNHYNVGDHIISYATDCFLRANFPRNEIVEISINEFAKKKSLLVKTVRPNDLIVMQGGGNMGNVYPTNERVRREIIGLFPRNRIFIFPETMYYTPDTDGIRDQLKAKKLYNRARELTICARENVSYSQMLEDYNNAQVLLMPDIVLALGVYGMIDMKRGKNILQNTASLFIRSDLESRLNQREKEFLEKSLVDMNFNYKYEDMIYNHMRGYAGRANRTVMVRSKFQSIAGSSVVVTDRLHAMILAALTETPCVVLANYNHKVRSFYETWLYPLKYIIMADSVNEVPDKIIMVMHERRNREDGVRLWMPHFARLAQILSDALQG